MIIAKKRSDIGKMYFVLDNVMFWEAFRWERFDTGYIYIQKFSNGKMYAGLTTNLPRRLSEYKKLKGSNKHHTRALKKHFDAIQIAFMQCPNYLLDTIEIFLIEFYDLTDKTKGYNKQTGGRRGYRMSKETRMKMSKSHYGKKGFWSGKTLTETHRENISAASSGENNPMYGMTHTEESRAKISEKVSGKMSGGKHPRAKPFCAFGKLYDSASTASDMLRDVCNTTTIDNYMKHWAKTKKHQHNIFYVSKEFYNAMKDTSEIITLDMYMIWIE
ncbi:GIY-YIG catalytic domain-containing endonuclease [Acanthocystis turfacea Chlorella virus NE-JV-2]|nr:GIY-YIG catalytic domain-containing endonuclease [Acanthocystis turfacea Chlorella virus NE-JV-2]